MRMVIYPSVDAHRLDAIRAMAGDMEVVNAGDENEAATAIREADAYFGKMTPRILAQSTRLSWVQSPTASLEHYLFPELVEHACELTNMRGIFSDVIADHVFAYVLAFARNLPTYLRQQSRAHWEPVGGESGRAGFISGPGTRSAIDRAHLHLADCTIGIVGLGGIGREVARRAAVFGTRVVAIDPNTSQESREVEWIGDIDRLDDLLAESDFVVIAAPHTPRTAKLFRRPRFQRMKRTAYLINVGRGVIVDLADLTAALAAGEIAGAGLDVYEVEPLPKDHPLWRMENVILTPHVAGTSPRIAERHLGVLLENIRRFVSREPLANVVDKRAWY